ncbi:MAG: class I SAM-dependent methyltransferase [Clostridiaceae bacterium]|nr:class I SAM-dependent methyltransferase [Clostridiaceae bacterium]
MDTTEYLQQYYARGGEDDRLLTRHGSVEFLTTVRYIEKYLRQGMKILEIGAGTGRYSHYFARRGFAVDAVELTPYNIGVFNANTQAGEQVRITQGDARDLSFLDAEQYDITLVLGPMYHLFCEKDKLAALSEALRVTKKGGIIFTAYCMNDGTVIRYGFMQGNIKEAVKSGQIDPQTFRCASIPSLIFEMCRKEEIDALLSHFHVTRLHYVGTDMATNYLRPTVDAMDDETFEIYLRYHFSICERPDLVGATHHSLDIFKKE